MAGKNSTTSRKSHLALYGNTKIAREFCPDCESHAFVLDGRLACCGRQAENIRPDNAHRMSEPEFERRRPNMTDQQEILEAQENRCFYCEREFGSWIWFRGRMRQIVIHWDHLVPYSYSANNQAANFVAACQWCNQWKHDRVFQTVDEARVFAAQTWEQKLAADKSQ